MIINPKRYFCTFIFKHQSVLSHIYTFNILILTPSITLHPPHPVSHLLLQLSSLTWLRMEGEAHSDCVLGLTYFQPADSSNLTTPSYQVPCALFVFLFTPVGSVPIVTTLVQATIIHHLMTAACSLTSVPN